MLRLARLFLLGCAMLFAVTTHAVTTTSGLYAHGPLTLYSPPPYSAFAGDVVTLQGYIDYTVLPGQILPDPGGTLSFYDGAQLIGTAALTLGNVYCVPGGTIPCWLWQARIDTASLSVGTHSITAVYSGDAHFGPSTSAVLTMTIAARPPPPSSVATTARLFAYGRFGGLYTPPPYSAFSGDVVTLQGWIEYTVLPGQILPDPSGTLSFYDGSQLIGTAAITLGNVYCVPGGTIPCSLWQAKIDTATLAVGAHSITAVYSGDTQFAASTSAVFTVNIDARPPPPSSVATSTGLYAHGPYTWYLPPPYSAFTGDVVTLQGWIEYPVLPGQILPDPTGTLSFYDGAQLIGTAALRFGDVICRPGGTVPCSFWRASIDTAALTVGTHAITAVYSGDARFAASTSAVFTVTINARPPTPSSIVTIAGMLAYGPLHQDLRSSSVFSGDVVTLQGYIDYSRLPGQILPNPGGTLSFYEDAQLVATVPLALGDVYCVPGGTIPCSLWQASIATASLPVGSHLITAVYSGDAHFAPSTSPVFTVVVNARPGTPAYRYEGMTGTASGLAALEVSGGGPTCGILHGRYVPIAGSDISPPPPPAGLSFPHGLVAFVIAGCTPGSTLSLTLHLPAAMASDTAFWKFGPTPDDPAPHWYRIPATVSGSTVTFTIVDGGLGDDDVTANGTVVDAGGPAIAAAVDSAEPIPALSQSLLVLMGIALAWLASAGLPSRAGRR